MHGYPILTSQFMSEKEWFNTRLNKWIPNKYLSRTKHKELRPYIIFINNTFMTHPNNLKLLTNQHGN